MVRCLPLAAILASLHVAHINFFVLDVEGAEISVLESVDWERVSFDVLCVEHQYSDERNRRIKALLAHRLTPYTPYNPPVLMYHAPASATLPLFFMALVLIPGTCKG